MNGIIDEAGRAFITLKIRADLDAVPSDIRVWVDTAFNGELVMPKQLIASSQFEQTAGIEARLADGNAVMLESFTCLLDWFGQDRAVEVIASDAKFPLLGIGLLMGRRLEADYTEMTVSLT